MNEVQKKFIEACSSGDIDLAKELYTTRGGEIDINVKNGAGYTAFNSACFYGHINVIKWLYSIDGKVAYTSDDLGNTPFLNACADGDMEIIKWLYSTGTVDIYDIDCDGYTAFIWAFSYGDKSLAEWLYSISDSDYIHVRDNDGFTAFMNACMIPNGLALAQWLYSIDSRLVNINDRADDGTTAFIIACTNDQLDTARWLYSIDPDCIHAKDNKGRTALSYACKYYYHDVTVWLIDLGLVLNPGDLGYSYYERLITLGH